MKKPNGNLRDQLLKEGIVYYGIASDGTIWENGKPLTTAPKVDPVKPTATVVARPTPTNIVPEPTDPAARKLPQGTGLMRAINAAIVEAGGTPIATRSKEKEEGKDSELTGLQRAIAANVKAAQKA